MVPDIAWDKALHPIRLAEPPDLLSNLRYNTLLFAHTSSS